MASDFMVFVLFASHFNIFLSDSGRKLINTFHHFFSFYLSSAVDRNFFPSNVSGATTRNVIEEGASLITGSLLALYFVDVMLIYYYEFPSH